jgi:endonuclease YncB( thermonuclease family)
MMKRRMHGTGGGGPVRRPPVVLVTAVVFMTMLSVGLFALTPAGTTTTSAQSGQRLPQPHTIRGTVTIDGQPAPQGLLLRAQIGAAICGVTRIQSMGAFEVQVHSREAIPGCGAPGERIYFVIQLDVDYFVRAQQSVVWREGGVTTDLGLTSMATPRRLPDTPTPATMQAPTPTPFVDSSGEVDWVESGEAVALTSGHRVRLYGIDAPEMNERCGPEAFAALDRLLTEDSRQYRVEIERGPELSEGDLALAYLWVGGVSGKYLLDELMVSFGFAYAADRAGQHRDRLVNEQSTAMMNQQGCLWSGT